MKFIPVSDSDKQLEREGSRRNEAVWINGFTSVMTVQFEGGVRVPANSLRKKRLMRLLRDTMKVVVRSPRECSLKGVFEKNRDLAVWKCVPWLVSYPHTIAKDKEVSGVRHTVVAKRSCFRCMVTGIEISTGQMSDERSQTDSKVDRIYLPESSRNNNASVSN